MKRIAKLLGIVVAILVLIAVALPFLVDANQFRPLLQAKLSEALGREVTLGSLQLSLLTGSVKATDLTIADDPAFSKTPFLRAQALGIGVEIMPMIFSHKLNVTGITIQQPEIDLIQTPGGIWNFSNLGAKPAASAAQAPSVSSDRSPELSVKLINISDGRVSLAKTGVKTKPLVLDKVNVQVTGFSPALSFPFSLSLKLAGGGEIKLDGKTGPIDLGNAASTPFDANLHATHLDPVLSGVLDASYGMAGLFSMDGTAKSERSAITISGKLKGEQLKLAKGGVPAKPNAELDIAVVHELEKQSGTLQHADIHLGKDIATLSGTYNLAGETPAVKMKLSGHNLAVTEIAAFLPALAIVLPAGASIDQGTAAVDATVDGPLNRLVESGTVDLENTRMANYDFASKLKVLDALAGIKAEPHTVIQTFHAKVDGSPAGIQVQEINLLVPSIGDITGAGTISPEQGLDFKMRVAVRSGLATVAGMGSSGGIPFTITGTSSDPSVKPDVKGLVTDKLKDLTGGGKSAADAAGNLLKGLFGQKK